MNWKVKIKSKLKTVKQISLYKIKLTLERWIAKEGIRKNGWGTKTNSWWILEGFSSSLTNTLPPTVLKQHIHKKKEKEMIWNWYLSFLFFFLQVSVEPTSPNSTSIPSYIELIIPLRALELRHRLHLQTRRIGMGG